MTEKHRKMLIRILVTFVLFIVLMIMDHSGIFSWMDEFPGGFFLYLVPYLLIGYDIIWKAARNIRNGQVFDENFLMMVATFAAFGVGEYSEALEYFDKVREERDDAFERYDRLYGPLEAGLSDTSDGWEWVKGAWPWETEE